MSPKLESAVALMQLTVHVWILRAARTAKK